MKVTFYLEILSSWCHWAEPAWAELKRRYEGQATFDWRIALMRPNDYPVSREQCEWFYRRSGMAMRSPYRLNSGWFEQARKGHYDAPNLVAEAGRELGFADDRLRLALSNAAVRDGRKIGGMAEAVKVAAAATRLSPTRLRRAAESAAVAERVRASTETFHSHQIGQRPAFILENSIGDKAVLSGLVRVEPLAATIDAMLADAASYAANAAHHGQPPPS